MDILDLRENTLYIGELKYKKQKMSRKADDVQGKKTAANCCKTFAKFLLSRLGISVMVILYSVIGGFIFEFLEKTNEKEECIQKLNEYKTLEFRIKQKLWNVSVTSLKGYKKGSGDVETKWETIEEFRKHLIDFRTEVLNINYTGVDCQNMGEKGGPGYRWTIPMAIQFSVTVITTIGNLKMFRR